MSQSESFIEEVSEEVRRDRLYGLLRRYGWIGIALVLALVGGAAWNEWNKARATAAAQAFGDALVAALDAGDAPARIAALGAVEAQTPGARVLREFLTVAELIDSGDTAAARARLDAIAADGQADATYRQLAGFKSLLLQGGETEPEARRLGFEGIAQTSQALRLPAEEQLALIEIEQGQTAAALSRLQQIQADAEATPGLRQRASQLIVALGGTSTPTLTAPAAGTDSTTGSTGN